MLLPLIVQFKIVCYSLLAGILTGVLFDGYRVMRGINVPIIIKAIEDTLFWILCAVIVFTFLLYFNFAFLGPYVYVFLIIGSLVYLRFFSIYVVGVEKKAGRGVSKGIRIIFKNFIYGLKVIFIQDKRK